MKKKNYLVLIGGAEDKRHDKKVLRRMIEATKARNVVVIPTASFYPREIGNDYYYAFRDLGVKEFECFDIRYADEADKIEYFKKLEKADLVFFSGGDQTKLVQVLKSTPLFERMFQRYQKGTLSIAGSSAGAAAAGDIMYYDGDYEGFIKGSANISTGFGFLENIAVDTHFLARGRIARMSQVMSTERVGYAIGIDEDTAIIFSPRTKKFEVVGSGMVTVMSNSSLKYSNYDNIELEEKICVDGLKVSFLPPGAKFSVKKWHIHISKSLREAIKNSLVKKLG